MAEAHPKATTKTSSYKRCAAALCNTRYDDRKDLTFMYFRRILAERLVSAVYARSYITAPGISNHKSFFFLFFFFIALVTLFEVCKKSIDP